MRRISARSQQMPAQDSHQPQHAPTEHSVLHRCCTAAGENARCGGAGRDGVGCVGYVIPDAADRAAEFVGEECGD